MTKVLTLAFGAMAALLTLVWMFQLGLLADHLPLSLGIPGWRKEIAMRNGGAPYFDPSFKMGTFICSRGDYGMKRSEADCQTEKLLEEQGLICGNYNLSACISVLVKESATPEQCRRLEPALGKVAAAECLSKFGLISKDVCRDAFANENIVEIVKAKCLSGDSAKWRNPKNQSALHLAVSAVGSLGVPDADYVVGSVDDVNAQDTFGNTALHYADDLSLNWFLRRLKKLADLSLVNTNSETVLISILKNGHHPLETDVRALVENGLNINAQDELGKTALHYLANVKVPESYRPDYLASLKTTMISLGADPNIRDHEGNLPP